MKKNLLLGSQWIEFASRRERGKLEESREEEEELWVGKLSGGVVCVRACVRACACKKNKTSCAELFQNSLKEGMREKSFFFFLS